MEVITIMVKTFLPDFLFLLRGKNVSLIFSFSVGIK
jgi:hypothetical protein